ncbi:MAG: hypothetical protein KBF66_02960 [Rhodoferax sp.]|nr:hypothetical protein [Rhodoferax sp.]
MGALSASGTHTSVDLLFELPAAIDGNLVLAAGEVVSGNELRIWAQLPTPLISVSFMASQQAWVHAEMAALTVNIGLRSSIALNLGPITGSPLPDLALSAELGYLSNTQRPTVGATTTSWQIGSQFGAGLSLEQQSSAPVSVHFTGRWQRGLNWVQDVVHHLPKVMKSWTQQRFFAYQGAACLRSSARLTSQDGMALALEREIAMVAAVRWPLAVGFRHQAGDSRPRTPLKSPWQPSRPLLQLQATDFQCASPSARRISGGFQAALGPAPGLSQWHPQTPPQQPRCRAGPYTPGGMLLLSSKAPADSSLRFLCEYHEDWDPSVGKPVVIAIRKVYVVINDVSLRRASNGVQVPLISMSLSLDASSWTWGFDAVLPHTAQNLIDAGGTGVVELLATVNGTTFAVLAENISRERSFGQTSIRLTGRGKNAVLAAPYAPVMTFSNSQARTARQLMDDVLSINGVSMGWSVDWGLTDWSVPAKVFSHQGTWIEALSVIAGAAGGYLLPHPRDQTIRVRHRYPVAPWEWATVTPNFVLPVDAVEKESLRWLEKPPYNRVFVSGVDAGVLAQVTRAGTAGDSLAPMVVDALITEATVARQRGLTVLGDTGRQIEVSLNLPVLLDTGIIEPGAFVQYRDGGIERIGVVRSTQVQAGFPEVWQTLGVQTYA